MSGLSVSVADPTSRSAAPPILERLDRQLSGPMFLLAAVSLLLTAGVIHRLGHGDWSALEATIIVSGVAVVWPLIALDGLLRLRLCHRPGMSRWRRGMVFLATCLFPPLRMGGRSYADAGKIWLPGLGLTPVNQQLRDRLERCFSVPMVLVAILVLPLLAVEYFWLDEIRGHFGLSLLLDIGTAVIWLAFALELILLAAVAEDKLIYAAHHWMDVAIVFLPLFEFLPILRLLRLAGLFELQEVSRLGRLYRLRGLLARFWRGILLLEMIHRVLGNYREKRLKRLRATLAARQAEIAELQDEIAKLDASLAKESPGAASLSGLRQL